jgi:hypothetical protein
MAKAFRTSSAVTWSLTRARTTRSGVRVAELSGPVTTPMFSELNEAAHSVQSALVASMNSVTSQQFCRPPMLIGCS